MTSNQNPIIKTKSVFLHFNFQSFAWFNALDRVLPLKLPLFIAFTPLQLQRFGGIDLVWKVFNHWKQKSAWKKVYLHLDHAKNIDLCFQAIKLGFDSVMFDGSDLSFEKNCYLTKQVVDKAHAKGILVEAELGKFDFDNYAKTQSNEVQRFTEMTKVDFLAVAVGNYHGLHERPAIIDFTLLKKIKLHSQAALVLHGASGLSISLIENLIQENLIQKINFDSDLQKTFIKTWSEQQPSFDYFAHYQTAITAVIQLIQFLTTKLQKKR